MTKIGIIGGSGLDDPEILKNAEELPATTPYGEPSSPLTVGELEGDAGAVGIEREGGVGAHLVRDHDAGGWSGTRHTDSPARRSPGCPI